MRNSYTIFVGKSERKRPLGELKQTAHVEG
jgi:hypothetical protein